MSNNLPRPSLNSTSGNTASFDQAVNWAKNNINSKREKHTWDDKFWYVIGGIIILIIILGLIYILYYRNKSKTSDPNDNVLDQLTEESNHIPQVAVTTTPRISQPSFNPPPQPSFNPPPQPSFNPPPQPSFNLPSQNSGGSYLPAISSNGTQSGWWYYP